MFIDFLTLVMINLVAGTALLGYYLFTGVDAQDQRPYAAGFFVVGLLGIILGLLLITTWPLPGSYNIAFGETTTLFGGVFLAAAISLAFGWDLLPTTVYAFFAGIDAALVGIRILSLNLTKEPLFSAFGFILAGLGGILAFPYMKWFKSNRTIRIIAGIVLAATVVIWAFTFYSAMWGHLSSFAKYLPPSMAK